MLTGTLRPVTNQESYAIIVGVRDDDTGDDIDLSGATIVLEIRSQDSSTAELSATTANGKITIPDLGYYRADFTRAEMQGLCEGTYDIGAVVTINDGTFQSILGALPVLDGVVSQ